MVRTLLRSKIHRAVVTEANLNYQGSVTIDRDLIDAAGLVPYEKVDILDCNNGSRLSTYVIEGERGSKEICINGAAARLVSPGDIVIILCYCQIHEKEIADHKPHIVFVNEKNEVIETANVESN